MICTSIFVQALSSAEATVEQQQNLCQLKVLPFYLMKRKHEHKITIKEMFLLLTFDIFLVKNVAHNPNYVQFARKLDTSYISEYGLTLSL